MTKIDYDQQALDFLKKTKTTIASKFLKNDYHFKNDTDKRDIYLVTITRGIRSFSFNFGQSLNKSGFYYTVGRRKSDLDRKYLEKDYFKGKQIGLQGLIKLKDHSFTPSCSTDKIYYPEAPSNYDILTCLTKYDPGNFEDFCSIFGYDTDSKTAEEIYEAVKQEWKNVQTIWTDEEIEELREIN